MRDAVGNQEPRAGSDVASVGGAVRRPTAGWPLQRLLFVALLVFVGCFLGAAFGTALQFPVVGAAALFLPYAVLTAALLLTPARWWWVMVLAAALGNLGPHLRSTGSISFVLLAEVANAARAIAAAGGVRLLGGPSGRLSTLRDMTIFLVFAALVGPLIGAFVGAADVTLHDRAESFWLVWQAWLLSNTLTGLTLLPAIMLVDRRPGTWIARARPRRFAEAAALSLGLMAIGVYLLEGSPGGNSVAASLYGPVPFLLWAAVRFGPTGTTAALSAMTIVTIHGAMSGRGPFVAQSAAENLLQLQLSLIAISTPMLLLAAAAAQNARAVSELRRGEMQYQSVVEDQAELICRFLPDGTCTFVNGAYCRYFGHSPEELLGRTFWMFIPERDHAAVRRSLESITIEHPVATIEHNVFGPGGDNWQQWTNRGLFDTSGRLVEYQAVGRDVTDRRRAEEEHRQLESQRRVEEILRETDRRKDEFLATLAHELRNPLAPLGFALEIIRRQQPADGKVARAQEVIARQVRHLARLVDDLTDISRITLGKITLKQEPVDLVSVAAEAVEGSRTVIGERRHELTVSLPDAPIPISGDCVRLTQIVTNLLNNAAKYTKPGGRIELTIARDAAHAVLSVRDNGVGIDPDMLQRIFDLFTQGHRGSDVDQGGLGIGLTLVRRLVELHGGQVEARSPGSGRGSEFVVRLPAIDQPASNGEVPVADAAIEGPPLRILIVDDNVDAADCLAELVAAWGHTAHVAHDGLAAMAAEAVFAPNAVLLDLGLPLVDGLEVARRLRQKRPQQSLLLVAITGLGQHDDRLRSAGAGFDHHFIKPVDVATLRSVLSRWAVEGLRNEAVVG